MHLLHLHHLHHGRVHAIHSHAASHSHLLLHHGHVLLHALQVLGHDLGRHASLAHLAGHLILVAAALVFAAAALSEFAASRVLFLLSHVTSRLGLLDLDRFSMDLEVSAQACIYTSFAFKGDESKAPRAASVFVHHKGRVDNTTKLGKVIFELLLGGFLADAAYEDLARLLLLVSWDSTLGVDLEDGDPRSARYNKGRDYHGTTYDLAVQEMLLHHDDVNAFGVLKGKEPEATGSSSSAISHDSTFCHLTELGEIVAKGF